MLEIAPYMLVAICRPTLYRSHIKVYRPPSLKWLQQKNQVCENAVDQISDRCDLELKKLNRYVHNYQSNNFYGRA